MFCLAFFSSYFYEGPICSLQIRVLFHIAYKQNNRNKFKQNHEQLQNTIEDQLCLASMFYLKGQYQDALEIYKKYLIQNRYISEIKINF